MLANVINYSGHTVKAINKKHLEILLTYTQFLSAYLKNILFSNTSQGAIKQNIFSI